MKLTRYANKFNVIRRLSVVATVGMTLCAASGTASHATTVDDISFSTTLEPGGTSASATNLQATVNTSGVVT